MAELSKKALFNAKNSGTAIVKDLEIVVVNVGTFKDVDKDGHEVTVSVLESKDGTMYTTISATVANSLDLLGEIIDEDKEVTVKVRQSISNNNREFYQLEII